MSKDYNNLTNIYSLAKTLRFELRPKYKTLEHLPAIVQSGKELSQHAEKFKAITNRVIATVIEDCLQKASLSPEKLQIVFDLAFRDRNQITDKEKKELSVARESLKAEIDQSLKCSARDQIFTGNLAQFVLDNYPKLVGDDKASVEAFLKLKGYLSDYLENRKNVFDRRTNETSVAYRTIEENLTTFLANILQLRRFLDSIARRSEFEDQLTQAFDKLEAQDGLTRLLTVDQFNSALSQTGIESYNLLISGKTLASGEKLQGVNELINLYLQQHPEEKLKKVKLKKLYKQIMAETDSQSFVLEIISDDEALKSQILDFSTYLRSLISERPIFKLIQNLATLSPENQSQIFFSNKNLNTISHLTFGDFGKIKHQLTEKFISSQTKITKSVLEKYQKQDYYSLAEILTALETPEEQKQLLDALASLFNFSSENEFIKEITQLETELNTELSQKTTRIASDQNLVAKIKTLLDLYKEFQFRLSLYLINDENLKLESGFYFQIDDFYSEVKAIIPLYNKVRNYLTKKPYSDEKIKLNFNNGDLLKGWSKSKEKDCFGTFFVRDNKFYIGIIDKETRDKEYLFDKSEVDISTQGSIYQKMELFFLSSPIRDFPKKYFSDKWQAKFPAPTALLEKYQYYREANHKEAYRVDRNYQLELIKFYQDQVAKDPDWQVYNFDFKSPESYISVEDFLDQISKQSYKMAFKAIPESYIKQLVADGKLYFFELYSKDFSDFSKGRPNLHTIYLKAIFDQINAKSYNYLYKISGFAEIFYRPASLELKITHPKHQPIKKKNPLHLGNENSVFEYDLIKDYRYTQDKFFLHLPIELNRTASGNDYTLNHEVNTVVYQREHNYILGIDRGERHLIYLVLIDDTGKIILQKTLNTIVNRYTKNNQTSSISTDYHQLLDQKQSDRLKSRQDWQSIENIKELKSGYLSHVINEIMEIIVKYQPIIMFENLNSGFKNSRVKIEKQVYQKFEKALIDKLNYLIRKDRGQEELGGTYRALQLTKPYSVKYHGRQNGIIYYIPASYTSNVDPTTGFMPFIYTRYENLAKSKTLFETFDQIAYEQETDLFCFTADYRKFRKDSKLWQQSVWHIYSYGDRIDTYKDEHHHWQSRELNLTTEFKQLFSEFKIDFHSNLKEQIISQTEVKFFQRLIHLLRLTLQLRNSQAGTEIDYIISPIKNNTGQFFDSRHATEALPKNADANGAYNIARKGLIVVNNIKSGIDEKKICDISNQSWFEFLEKEGGDPKWKAIS